MGNPLYRVRASGSGGSGYGIPPLPDQAYRSIKNADGNQIDVAVDEDGKPIIVPGVTTVLKQGNQDGIAHWAAQQTAAYAVTHIDSLLSRTEEAGYGFLQYHWKREPDWESDDLLTAYDRVLHDSAELGTAVHDYLEWRLGGEQGFAPELNKPEFRQMAEQVDLWLFENRVEVHAIEETWWGDHYAGTLDLVATVNGTPFLLDAKTSRHVQSSHKRQLAALHNANKPYKMDGEGNWYVAEKPHYEQFGFLHIRPDDWDSKGNFIPAFCRLEVVDEAELDVHWKAFQGLLQVARSEQELKKLAKAGR